MTQNRNLSHDLSVDYFDGKQSLHQLSETYHLSIKTIRSKLTDHQVIIPEHKPSETVIIMDTTYFRRGFGVMVFKDAHSKNNLDWRYIKTETVDLYKRGIRLLKMRGWTIKAIVCDGRRGLFKAFPGIPIPNVPLPSTSHHTALFDSKSTYTGQS